MDDLIKQYCEYVHPLIDEEGIYPTPGIVKNADDTLSIYAMATQAPEIIMLMFSNSRKPEIVEQIFALDTFTKEGQGTTLDSCLILFHVARDEQARVGVMEYSWNAGQPLSKAVDWNNPFWTKTYARLANDLTRKFRTL